jgi:hypothetical protein
MFTLFFSVDNFNQPFAKIKKVLLMNSKTFTKDIYPGSEMA